VRRWRAPIWMRGVAWALLTFAFPCVASAHGHAASPSETGSTDRDLWKASCAKLVEKPGKSEAKTCATYTFTARPFHFLVQNVVPGGGYGGGGEFVQVLDHGIWQAQLKLTGVMTIRQYWFAQTDFTARRPSFGSWNQGEENFAVEVYARNRQMPSLPFYGLGPNTSLSNAAQFSERDTRLGIQVSNPLTSWLGAAGTLEGIWPEVGGASGKSLQSEYSDQTAPGLNSQPSFVHYEVLLNPHVLLGDRFQIDYAIRYGFFQDTGTGHYSFRRLDADFKHEFYPERKNGHRRLDSVLIGEARIAASDTSRGGVVPFYMQETIGGSDVDNRPTLRAFKDYRFRAPNLILFQGEFDRRMYGPFGVLLFYDAGQVALQNSGIDFDNFRQGFGGGLSVFLGGKIVFKAYVGLGGGEGIHPFFGIPSFLPN
jgi:hypothetical protein